MAAQYPHQIVPWLFLPPFVLAESRASPEGLVCQGVRLWGFLKLLNQFNPTAKAVGMRVVVSQSNLTAEKRQQNQEVGLTCLCVPLILNRGCGEGLRPH